MCFIIISASSKKLLLILYGHPSIKKARLLFAANRQVNNYGGPYLEKEQDNMWIFYQKFVELGLLYKQVRFEKFCMCSFCGSMGKVSIVAHGKIFSG